MLANTGTTRLYSQHNLLSTIAYQIGGETTFGLEGSIFISGAIIQWLRDGLQSLPDAGDSEEMAKSLSSNEGVYMVPALTGLVRHIGRHMPEGRFMASQEIQAQAILREPR